MSPQQQIQFVLSVDTEEEWNWSGPFPQDDCSVKNIDLLPQFQSFCDELGIKPTYFVDYAVAENQRSAKIISDINLTGNCEIGAHLHPWCNPPYIGDTDEYLSHVINLPLQLVAKKLDFLLELFATNLSVQPKAFRTGRWGINSQVLRLLAEKGLCVDSSVYPFYANDVFDCDEAELQPYWPSYDNPMRAGSQREIFEVPITAGYNRSEFRFWNRIHRKLSEPPLSWVRPIGTLWHTKLLRKIYLSPELSAPEDMNVLIEKAIKGGQSTIHMYMHSSSLLDASGSSEMPYQGIDTLSRHIRNVVDNLNAKYSVSFCRISDIKSNFSAIEASAAEKAL